MAKVVSALVGVVTSGKPLAKPDPAWVARLATATGDARKLLEAVVNHKPASWKLGIRCLGKRFVTFEPIAARVGKTFAFDTDMSCALGTAFGPIEGWGFKWDRKKLELVEVSDKGKVTTYTPDAWLAKVRKEELRYWQVAQGVAPSKRLVEFLAAAGAPVAATKPAKR